MLRALSEKPEGLVYRAELLSAAEEQALLERVEALRFDPVVLHGQAARRTARHFGLGYDYDARTPLSGEPLPEWLEPARSRAGALAGHDAEALVEALVQRYPPGSGIGWHRDAPAFGVVVGISLKSDARLRLQRGRGEDRRVWEVLLEPRSGYVLEGKARTAWQHSIPATKELRFSITFRTLRRPTIAVEDNGVHT
jgi:alkylated DNA repair dioxygenase AlkB